MGGGSDEEFLKSAKSGMINSLVAQVEWLVVCHDMWMVRGVAVSNVLDALRRWWTMEQMTRFG